MFVVIELKIKAKTAKIIKFDCNFNDKCILLFLMKFGIFK